MEIIRQKKDLPLTIYNKKKKKWNLYLMYSIKGSVWISLVNFSVSILCLLWEIKSKCLDSLKLKG